jgi:hypothetical protein
LIKSDLFAGRLQVRELSFLVSSIETPMLIGHTTIMMEGFYRKPDLLAKITS